MNKAFGFNLLAFTSKDKAQSAMPIAFTYFMPTLSQRFLNYSYLPIMILISLQILIGIFFSILFLQSGLDKVFDFKGNQSYVKSVFENTFLKPVAPLLFITITLLEAAAGFLCAVGSIFYFFNGDQMLLSLGLQVSAISLLALFLGQRIAKDYAGAAGLVAYFLLAAFGIYLFV